VNVAERAGIEYQWTIPGSRPLNILQTIGNGCAFLDVDQDGSLDVLLVGPKLALYLGDGKGHFTDATAAYGLDKLQGHFLGCAIGDYDNDGYPDIYLTAYRGGLLLHNEPRSATGVTEGLSANSSSAGTSRSFAANLSAVSKLRKSGEPRRFRDVTIEAGIAPQPWGTSASFVDFDGDGKLDLYIANYVQFDPKTSRLLCSQSTSRGGALSACGPERYDPLRGVLYRNLSGRHFADVTQQAGALTHSGKGLGVAAADYDGSGRQSIAIANDDMPGDLLQNSATEKRKKSAQFQNVGIKSGVAFGPGNKQHGGMGIDWGDYDNDGRLDLLVTTFYSEEKCLYHNDGDGLFSFAQQQTGVAARSINMATAFGCRFFDVDNDGWLDFAVACGHVQDNVEEFAYYDHSTYRQPTLLLHNRGGQTAKAVDQSGERTTANASASATEETAKPAAKNVSIGFENLSEHTGAGLQKPIVGRGLATGDFDNDGRMDLLVVDSEGSPLLLHNESKPVRNWIGFRLIGSGGSSRDAYGAQITLSAGGRSLLRHCHADGSYMSSSDPRVHFGLGQARQVETLTIRWPDGSKQVLHNLAAGKYYTFHEPPS